MIGERESEKELADRIQREYDIAVRHEENEGRLVFSVQEDGQLSALKLMSRAAAMRRNPQTVSAGRPPCMADIERVETKLLAFATPITHCREAAMRKLISGALAYQNQARVPLCLIDSLQEGLCESLPGAELMRQLGFQYIYDRPSYALNTETISVEMLERAAGGETVSLDIPDTTLQVAAGEDLLSLAHFVNARLCRQYGFFMIRSASYYEGGQKRLLGAGGNLFQIMEHGIRRGYFACAGTAADSIREAVFDPAFDRECYILTEKGNTPAVMARIVNLPEMLRYVTGNGRITIAVRLKDPAVAGNDGLFIWYIDEKGSRMERVEAPDGAMEKEPSMRPEVTTTIGEFTAFIFEYMKLKQSAKFDSIYLAGPVSVNDIY